MANSTILEMRDVRKTFGSVVALHDVDLQLNKGEIHGLLGGNGAGKTTLMNILYGLYKPDAGMIIVNGRQVHIQSPRDALSHGVGMVHQHFLQVQNFTVTENIVLGTSLPNRPTLDLTQTEQRIAELSHHFGLEVNPRAVIGDLPMGVRQRVEILKALYRGVNILILDEPTTNLTPQEVDALFQSLRLMVKEGLSVVFITHKLREVLSVCDTISVLRHGRRVLTLPRNRASAEAFVRAMVGEEMDIDNSLLFSGAATEPETLSLGQQVIVEVQDLLVLGEEGVPVINDCSFQICACEVLGLAGVAGNGQRELAESLLRLRPIAGGHVIVDGVNVSQVDTQDLLEMGVAYVPEDRLDDGFLPTANVAQNLILGVHRQRPYSNGRFLDWKSIVEAAKQLIAEFNIKTQGPQEVAANLSGGNIQRVMLARVFSRPLKFLIAHNPTQGLDIPSIEFVYGKLLAARQAGMATLLISEDMDELFLLCNRVAAIYNGEIMGILERHQFDKYELGRMMSGVKTNG